MRARILMALCLVTGLPAQLISGGQSKLDPLLPPQIPSTEIGESLARNLRSSMPEEDAEFKAVLKIRSRDGQVRRVPINGRITVGQQEWQVRYTLYPTGPDPSETLVIRHRIGQPNLYQLASPPSTTSPQTLSAEAVNHPLAGSDFWLADLGMDFLHWPNQRFIKTEMRKGRWCHVLESSNPSPTQEQYRRVLCWLDKETGQPILAESFDA